MTYKMLFDGAAAFVVMAGLDFVWARYVLAVKEHNRFRASNMASIIMLLNGLVTLLYVDDPRMLVPAALGAWIGTWAGMYIGKRK